MTRAEGLSLWQEEPRANDKRSTATGTGYGDRDEGAENGLGAGLVPELVRRPAPDGKPTWTPAPCASPAGRDALGDLVAHPLSDHSLARVTWCSP